MRYVLLILALCAIVVGVLFLTGPAGADTIVVDDDWGGADHDTIAAAISAARPGDTIRVHAGTYYEDNVVDKPLDLVGNGTATVIDGKKKDHVFGFRLTAGDTNVSGFTFHNWWPTHHYGGVGVYSDGNRISNNTFIDNNRGLFLGACSDNLVIDNTFDDNFYGLLVHEGSDDCTVSFNTFTRTYSHGILYRYSQGLTLFSNTFVNFTSGAMSIYRCSDVTLSYNMFDASDASSGRRLGPVLYNVTDAHVHNNTLIDLGRGLTAVGTKDLTVEHNTILGGSEGLYFGRLWSGQYQLGDWCNGTVVRNNNIIGQGIFGANATYGQVSPIDARYNWWGADSGPFHPVTNSKGAGSNVSDTVTFANWLAKMVSPLPPVACIQMVSPSLVNEGEPVLFVGRGLARNETVEHLWSSSIDGQLYSGTGISFARTDLSPGTHTISLKVRDVYGAWSGEATTRLVVNGIPSASIESISPPVVNDGETVTFVGSAQDHEDDIRYVQWESDIDGVLSNALEFETASLSNGTHVITLRVMDGHEAWSEVATDEVIVNGRPRAIIEAVEHTRVNEGEPVIFRGTYLDHEDGIIAFWWGSDVDGELSDQMMFHTSDLSNGTHVITYRVLDDFNVWSENATVTVVVNGLPRVSIVSILPRTPTTGDTVRFEGSWTDHEANILAFDWTSDIDGPLSTHEDFGTTHLSRGVHTITFRALDGQRVWSERAWATVTVNGRPTAWIEPTNVSLVNEGEPYHLAGGFSDPEGEIRGYEWSSDLDGVVGTGWNLTTSRLSNGTHVISFRARDDLGAWSGEARVEVTVNGPPEAVIVSITPSSALQGESVGFTGSYVDHEGDPFEFEWSSDRDGFLSHDMGFVTDGLSNGTHVISLRVMDGYGVWSEPVTARAHVNGLPRCWIETAEPPRTDRGERVHLAGAGEDDTAVVAYRWSSSIDGVLSGISVFSTRDLSPGVHEVTFTVQDDQGVWSDPATVIIEVTTPVPGARVLQVDVPDVAFEGDQVTIGCVVANVGDVTLLDLVVEMEVDDRVVGVHTLNEPLHPGDRKALEVLWTAEVGTHVVLVSLFQDEVLLHSSPSGGSVQVEPLPDPAGQPDPGAPVPDDGDRIVDGRDVQGMAFLLLATAAFVAASYISSVRLRRHD